MTTNKSDSPKVDEFNFEFMVSRLDAMQNLLPALVQGLSNSDSQWKPQSGNWSVLEIVCHLAHEEIYDFRSRVRSTIESPTKTWDPIDPERTVIDEKFNQRDLQESVVWFLNERERSIEWLRQQIDSRADAFGAAYNHPQAGWLSAKDLLANWVAHDQLHVRQIAKRIHELTQRWAPNSLLHYAGDMN